MYKNAPSWFLAIGLFESLFYFINEHGAVTNQNFPYVFVCALMIFGNNLIGVFLQLEDKNISTKQNVTLHGILIAVIYLLQLGFNIWIVSIGLRSGHYVSIGFFLLKQVMFFMWTKSILTNRNING